MKEGWYFGSAFAFFLIGITVLFEPSTRVLLTMCFGLGGMFLCIGFLEELIRKNSKGVSR